MNKESFNIHLSLKINSEIDSQIETYAAAQGLAKPEAVRKLLASKCNDLSTDLLQVKTVANLTAMETAETRKHMAKISEIIATKIPATDKNIEAIETRLAAMEKTIEAIGKVLINLSHKIK